MGGDARGLVLSPGRCLVVSMLSGMSAAVFMDAT